MREKPKKQPLVDSKLIVRSFFSCHQMNSSKAHWQNRNKDKKAKGKRGQGNIYTQPRAETKPAREDPQKLQPSQETESDQQADEPEPDQFLRITVEPTYDEEGFLLLDGAEGNLRTYRSQFFRRGRRSNSQNGAGVIRDFTKTCSLYQYSSKQTERRARHSTCRRR